MTYSQNLRRHINVPIEWLNHFDYAEVDAAIGALPNYPETTPQEIRKAAAEGNINARFIIAKADEGDDVAKDWV
jgi:hypothetical protein